MDGLTSQNVIPVDGEGLPGKALEKRWCLSQDKRFLTCGLWTAKRKPDSNQTRTAIL